jgi:hypothetical protein
MGYELAVPIHYCDPQDPAEFISAVKILAPWMEVKRRQPGGEMILSVIKPGARIPFFLKES